MNLSINLSRAALVFNKYVHLWFRLTFVEGVTRGHRGLQGVTRGYIGLQGVTGSNKGLEEVKRGRTSLNGVTGVKLINFVLNKSKW